MSPVARPRRTPPSTPFGVWLDHWFKDNPNVTYESFAQDVGGITKSAVSLWISAVRPVAVKPATLRAVAKRTGARLEDLERMTYGETAGERRVSEPPGIYLTEEQLEALMERAAATAVRQVLDERARDHGE